MKEGSDLIYSSCPTVHKSHMISIGDHWIYFFLSLHFRIKTPRYKSVKPDGAMQRLKISKNVGIPFCSNLQLSLFSPEPQCLWLILVFLWIKTMDFQFQLSSISKSFFFLWNLQYGVCFFFLRLPLSDLTVSLPC